MASYKCLVKFSTWAGEDTVSAAPATATQLVDIRLGRFKNRLRPIRQTDTELLRKQVKSKYAYSLGLLICKSGTGFIHVMPSGLPFMSADYVRNLRLHFSPESKHPQVRMFAF